jgi:HEAT repeat protein
MNSIRHRGWRLGCQLSCLTMIKVLLISLIICLSWITPSWAQLVEIDPQVTPLLEKLVDRDAQIRLRAADALVDIGSPAIPALRQALCSEDTNLRWRAAAVLGDLGTEAIPALSDLARALKDPDAQVRLYAMLALGNIGPAAKPAVPTIVAALQDPDPYVRIYAPTALRKIGVAAKVAVPALTGALKDPNGRVRLNAAYALGAMGTEATPALPTLVKTLDDALPYVRVGAIKGLAEIVGGFQDQAHSLSIATLRKVITEFEPVLAVLESRPDRFTEADIVRIRRPLQALITEKETRWSDKVVDVVVQYPWLWAGASYLILLPSLWGILLQIRPIWLLQLNNALQPYSDFSLPIIGIKVPLRSVLFVNWFHYHPKVLDAWVATYRASAQEQFSNRETVQARSCYIPVPVVLDGVQIAQLTPDILQTTFNKQRSCLVIWGEGGVGKTSLACKLATWALADDREQRLCSHPMLPILLEEDLRPLEGQSALLEAIRGQLQALIDQPEPLCPALLVRLLRQRRILVIVDRFSELNATTRASIQPESPDFPINALVITSRLEEKLGRVNRTLLKPLRIESNRLSSFMDAYLVQKGQRDRFTDPEFFAACQRLSLMVGPRMITVLLAKLYAEQLIASLRSGQPDSTATALPETIPSLMLGYLNELNRDITENRYDDRAIHQDAKLLAWLCLQTTFQPNTVKRSEALASLGNLNADDAETRLDYLEHRLQLIQTVGAAKDQLRFCLDPLAEYLAGLHLVEQYGNQNGQWRPILKQADTLIMQGTPGAIQGFLLALYDCYLSQVPGAKPTEFVPQQLAQLSGLKPSDLTTGASIVLTP